MDPQFENYCMKWSSEVANIVDDNERISYFKGQLPSLLLDASTIRSVLQHMIKGRKWPDLKRSELFSHEVLLYLDPSRRFSVRLYFHSPKAHTDIHDHTSWGISGTPFGKLSVIRYHPTGSDHDGRVMLRRTAKKLLKPGDVEFTRPWDEGIHKTGSADDRLNVMISIYGRPGRRLYVNFYDQKTGKVNRVYPPRMFRRKLAQEALKIYGSNRPLSIQQEK